MIHSVKRSSWVAAMLLLALAFPLQVVFNNPSMASLAYIPIFLIYGLSLMHRRSPDEWRVMARASGMDVVVALYIALIMGHLVAAFLLRQIPMQEVLRQTFLFILPATLYFYASRLADEKEFESIFIGIVAAALIVGLYFVYDSFSRLASLRLDGFQVLANDYSIARMGISAGQINAFRTSVGSRAMGLLETHTASGAWIGLGAFASFSLLSGKSKSVRWIAGLWWLILLLGGLNFTSILAFLITLFFVYGWRGDGLDYFRKVRKSSLRQITSFVILALEAAWAIALYSRNFANNIAKMVLLQLTKIFTIHLDWSNPDRSWIAWTIMAIKTYLKAASRRPLVLLLGAGPVASGDFVRGGDSGFLETLAFLGLPLFALMLIGFLITGRQVLGELRVEGGSRAAGKRRGLLEFGLAVALFVLIFEAHYSIWAYKSVLPILFLALGLIRRYGRAAS